MPTATSLWCLPSVNPTGKDLDPSGSLCLHWCRSTPVYCLHSQFPDHPGLEGAGKQSGYSFAPGLGFPLKWEQPGVQPRHRKWHRVSDSPCCPGVVQVQAGRDGALEKGWCSVIKGWQASILIRSTWWGRGNTLLLLHVLHFGFWEYL